MERADGMYLDHDTLEGLVDDLGGVAVLGLDFLAAKIVDFFRFAIGAVVRIGHV